MFFYGLDFHHLAPNSILHIAAFITVYEAFLRVEPHFGLWLKIFSIKPKSSGAQLADCGGAMVSKLPKVTWPEGTFVETIKVWQREWFYITELPAEGQTEIPAFTAEPPKRLVSWTKKGLDWGNPDEVKAPQKRIKSMIGQCIKLVDVIQVMLQRRNLPLQLRANPMWLYKPEDEVTVRNFFRSDLDGMWTMLFKPSKSKFPKKGEDCGLDAKYGPSEVKAVYLCYYPFNIFQFLTK